MNHKQMDQLGQIYGGRVQRKKDGAKVHIGRRCQHDTHQLSLITPAGWTPDYP